MERQNDRDVDLYEMITRFGGVVLAVLLWGISMRFSVDGFKISVQDDAWIGWVLGLMVTYLQIMFNRGAPNKTLHIAGVVAYAYGMSTNLIGLFELRGGALATWETLSANPLSGLLQVGVVLTLAAAVEVIPEHLIIYCIRQDGQDGDFIDSLFRGMPKKNQSPRTGFQSGKAKSPRQLPVEKDNRQDNRKNNRGGGDNRSQHQQRQPRPSNQRVAPMGDGRQSFNPRDNVTIRNMED